MDKLNVKNIYHVNCFGLIYKFTVLILTVLLTEANFDKASSSSLESADI